MATFSESDHRRIAEAIAEAERHTSGEIFCIVTDQKSRDPQVVLAIATLAAFVLPLVAVLLGLDPLSLVPRGDAGWRDGIPNVAHSIEAFAALQLLLFLIVAALAAFTPLGPLLTPHGIKRDRVHAQAMSQFLAKGLHVTAERTGVLIFVSLADHHAEVIADEAIFAKVSPECWGETIAALIERIRAGDPAEGFVRAIGIAGRLLAEHFPPRPHNPNELPDKLVEL